MLGTHATETSRAKARGAPKVGLRRLAPALLPAAIFLLAMLAPAFIFHTEPRAMGKGLGPAAWPRGFVSLLALFALAWTSRFIWVIGAAGRSPSLTPPREDGHYSWTRAGVGLGLIVAYGCFLPIVGFAVATTVFITVWCLVGGMRNPVAVGGVAIAGTAGLLWMFMGIALMPLSRGQGAFNEFSISLLRLLGIY